MPAHKEQRLLPWTPEQLFDLVADVESYPQFLPWCLAARIRERNGDKLTADLVVGHKVWRETFTSHVWLNRPGRIEVSYGGGPLSRLHNAWGFEAATTESGAPACQLSVELELDMRSPLLRRALDIAFDHAVARIVSAFETRARVLYG